MKRQNTLRFIYTALFAALIFIATALLPKIYFAGGYAGIGDAFIYISCFFLPFPFSAFAAAFGSSVADLFSGYLVYFPFTLIIKTLICLAFFKCKQGKIPYLRLIFALIINSVGYFISDCIIYSFATAIYDLPFNAIQSFVCSVLYILFLLAVKKSKLDPEKIFKE